MNRSELATEVAAVSTRDSASFDERVRDEARWLLSAIVNGEFDSSHTTVGLEYECYGVDDEGSLLTMPQAVIDRPGMEKEIGRHQVELQVSPQPFSAAGLEAIESEVRARFEAANEALAAHGGQLASGGMWTIPPTDKGALEYLTESDGSHDVPLATNMVDTVRYHAQGHGAATRIDAPHVTHEGETALLNSLTTSIQPHHVVPEATELPRYHRYALRVAGPLLALGVNSPLFPPDLYEAEAAPRAVLTDCRMENRIGVFESVMNAEDEAPKATFPADVDSVGDAVSSVVEDPTILPMQFDERDDLTHFSHKHGCYWRWIRPVFDERSDGTSNVRIEFRPIPGQPTIRDSVAFVGLFSGLLTALPRMDHPVAELDWATARDNFYGAAADGLDADLEWLDREGDRTDSVADCYDDLFACARQGLSMAGFEDDEADRVLAPLESRVTRDRTPADWKLDRVEHGLDAGLSFERAVEDTQRAYLRMQAETFEDGCFARW
ncbi:hypothetical protein [Haloarchaeobius amylolyticus]|uniref:hypothetical protein n=1 Tax=Haloarchaeobius amylolyticus TaxID=1198296 RepID=UPI00226F190C|nr:hypothetical protein [Haloarchaeobius amylolyticus]